MGRNKPNKLHPTNFLKNGYQGLLPEDLRVYLRKWIPLSLMIGGIAGLGAVVFQWLLVSVWNLSYEIYETPWYLRLFIPALGGLIVGIIITRLSPESSGGGTDRFIDAIHHRGGKVPPKMAPLKIIVASITIGTGGSAGRAGPIMSIGAAISTYFGQRLGLKAGDMRTFAIAGAAAGLSAVFRAPLGAAIYAIEVPYKNDLESGAIIPSIISSVVSYLIFVSIYGYEPLFQTPDIKINVDLVVVLGIIILGVLAGLTGRLFIATMRLTERLVSGIKSPFPIKIMFSGLLVGCMGLFIPEVLGLGEGVIVAIIGGSITSLGFLLALLLGKMVATSITVGSGSGGGVFFPFLIMGGTLGTLFAIVLDLEPLSLYAIAGMGAIIAGVSKTPVAASVLMAEMVGGYIILIPVMISSTVSYIIMGDHGLFRTQVTRRPFIYDPAALDEIPVERIMRKEPIVLTSDMTIDEAVSKTSMEPHYLYPVVDDDGKVLGVILNDALKESDEPRAMVDGLIIRHYEHVMTGTSAYQAFEDMNTKQISRVLVIGREDNRLKGVLTRIDLMEYLEHTDEEHRLY